MVKIILHFITLPQIRHKQVSRTQTSWNDWFDPQLQIISSRHINTKPRQKDRQIDCVNVWTWDLASFHYQLQLPVTLGCQDAAGIHARTHARTHANTHHKSIQLHSLPLLHTVPAPQGHAHIVVYVKLFLSLTDGAKMPWLLCAYQCWGCQQQHGEHSLGQGRVIITMTCENLAFQLWAEVCTTQCVFMFTRFS